ncbi:MAG: RNA methyltransferase [Sulfurimonas sp.]|nr:RNA methyltransferase [Sulfurimonas sp.]
MKLINVQNSHAPELEIYYTMRDNAFNKLNSFVADSPKVVNILLGTDLKIKSILATKEYYDEFQELIKVKNISKLYLATKEQMQCIVGHKIHHNCMAHGIRPKEFSLNELDDNILMLDTITSTENIGSIARSAAALGVNSYLVPSNAPHPFSRRALRVSMGHVSKLKISIYEDIYQTISKLKLRGYKIFAAEITDDSSQLKDVNISTKWVLLMGHEGKGLSKEILDICDEVVTIEMAQDVRSLNVAVASSIMMYQFKIGN